METKKINSLLFCVLMDLIGCATYAVPGFGEIGDIFWAPVSAFIFYKMFGGWKGATGGIFNFIEEVLPGTDFIPTFTLMWLWQNARQSKKNSVTA
ncbi:MAG: hypothetical protein QM764_03615 [Chitinophagaceae bacterium]